MNVEHVVHDTGHIFVDLPDLFIFEEKEYSLGTFIRKIRKNLFKKRDVNVTNSKEWTLQKEKV